ncbi:unnamed protein product [Sphagnum balticum]
MSALAVEVLKYDDNFDDDHNAVTHYIVTVTNTKTKHSYELKKRYSEFAKLYESLKDRYDQVEAFRFPKKSLFNTHEAFTKERRKTGFNDFLKLLVALSPVPRELSEFLELESFFFQDAKKSEKRVAPVAYSEKAANATATASASAADQHKQETKSAPGTQRKKGSVTTQQNVRVTTPAGSSSMFHLLVTSFIIVSVLYLFFNYLRVIDISSTTNEETPFFGGKFRLKLVLGDDYPNVPPKGYFITKIYHPNIATNGDICVNTLKKDWTPDVTLKHVLQVIRCLLIVPFPESSLNDEAGKLFMDSYEEFARRAKIMTEVHAMSQDDENIAGLGSSVNLSHSKTSADSSSSSSSSSADKHSDTAFVENEEIKENVETQKKKDTKKKNLKRL